MSASICQRPSSIDRRDKRLGNGQARSRRHRIKRAVGPIRPRSFRVHANYLDALNASRVRIHRQKPKVLGLKFGCGFTWHLFHQGSPASGYRPLGGGAVTAQAQAGTRSFDRLVGAGEQRRRGDRMRRRLPPSARSSVMPAAIFETGSSATTTPIAPAVPRVFAFPCTRSSQSSLIQRVLAASTRRTA
jgi:hypothetical protein